MIRPRRISLAAVLALAACGAPQPIRGPLVPPSVDPLAHVPDFARRPFEVFSRTNAVAIALREWRAWGSPVNDDPPGSHPDLGDAKPERQPGLWQRVGEYWWLGQNADQPANGWTGKHDSFGTLYAPTGDEQYAWSAAFISYVMRTAGAGTRFAYSPSHATYINIAAQMAQGTQQNWAVIAERADSYAPQPGDLICHGRRAARTLRFEDLPAGPFTSHCDLVIGPGPDGLSVIGGNVEDSVTLKHVPIDGAGRIAGSGNVAYDRRYPWMVVLRVLYEG
jgi:hypothetical protein